MMKRPLETLLHRIPPATPRNLWLLSAGAVAFHNLWVIHFTQRAPTLLVFSLLCWWGALTCMEDRIEELRIHPSTWSLGLGSGLLLWCLVRSGLILDLDTVIYLVAPLEVIALAMICVPIRQLKTFWQQIVILALVPLSLVGQSLYPEKILSEFTATLSSIFLTILGFNVISDGRVVTISGQASVSVMERCSGYEQIAQVLSITIIFLLAFPLRKIHHRLLVLAAAPIIAILANTVRIALLNIIIYVEMMIGSSNRWWFDFFHEGEGSLVFSGIAVCLSSWLYLKVLDRELNRTDSMPVHNP
jgi:cyanoexosortase A